MTDPFVRLRRLSRRMRQAVILVGLLIALGIAGFLSLAIVDPATFEAGVARGLAAGVPLAPTPWAIAVTVLLMAVQAGVLLTALWCTSRMFGALTEAEPLSETAARWMTRASLAFLATAVTPVVLHPLTVLALTMANPPGQRALSISLGSADLLALLVAGIMFMTGRVLAVAAEIRADQRAFV
ncbi:MAG: hypothetical protein RLO50_18455 [Azospirillaceae bacterium]